MDAPTDEQLLREYLDGDAAGFELLVRRHVQELHQFAYRFTGSTVAAEDVVQESFLQMHVSAGQFDLGRRFKPWLFTIAANKARDHLRRRKRKPELSFEAYVSKEDDADQRFVSLLAGDSAAPDDGLALEEKRATVRAAVEVLPSKLSEVLILAYYHRFAYKDIAEIAGIPLGTVKSRLHAAITAFAGSYRETAKRRVGGEP